MSLKRKSEAIEPPNDSLQKNDSLRNRRTRQLLQQLFPAPLVCIILSYWCQVWGLWLESMVLTLDDGFESAGMDAVDDTIFFLGYSNMVQHYHLVLCSTQINGHTYSRSVISAPAGSRLHEIWHTNKRVIVRVDQTRVCVAVAFAKELYICMLSRASWTRTDWWKPELRGGDVQQVISVALSPGYVHVLYSVPAGPYQLEHFEHKEIDGKQVFTSITTLLKIPRLVDGKVFAPAIDIWTDGINGDYTVTRSSRGSGLFGGISSKFGLPWFVYSKCRAVRHGNQIFRCNGRQLQISIDHDGLWQPPSTATIPPHDDADHRVQHNHVITDIACVVRKDGLTNMVVLEKLRNNQVRVHLFQ